MKNSIGKEARFLFFVVAIFVFSFLISVAAYYFTGAFKAPESDPQLDYGKGYLPPDAANVQDHGKGWVYFELDTSGRTRKFLYHMPSPIRGARGETLVELKE